MSLPQGPRGTGGKGLGTVLHPWDFVQDRSTVYVQDFKLRTKRGEAKFFVPVSTPAHPDTEKRGVSIGKRRSLGKTSVQRQTSIDRAVPTVLGVQQGRESRPPGKCQAQGGDHKVDLNFGGTQAGEQWYLGQGLGKTLGRPDAKPMGT